MAAEFSYVSGILLFSPFTFDSLKRSTVLERSSTFLHASPGVRCTISITGARTIPQQHHSLAYLLRETGLLHTSDHCIYILLPRIALHILDYSSVTLRTLSQNFGYNRLKLDFQLQEKNNNKNKIIKKPLTNKSSSILINAEFLFFHNGDQMCCF